MKIPPIPEALFLEAFVASREKRLWLARIYYRWALGPAWRHALLGFSYLKCLDDAVDEDPDAARASAVLERQRSLMERIYAGAAPDANLPIPDRYGAFVFTFDRMNGATCRRHLEDVIESMEVDLARRGRTLPAKELERNLLLGGGAYIRALVWLVDPKLEPSEQLVNDICFAYIGADWLIDFEHDLRFGVINIPAEDVAHGVDPRRPDAALVAWQKARSKEIEARFDVAFAGISQVENLFLRVLLHVNLRTKRRAMRRFLARASGGQATWRSGSA